MKYPILERAPFNIEVPRTVRGKPGHRWVQGWQVRYSETRVSIATTYHDGRVLLAQAKQESKGASV